MQNQENHVDTAQLNAKIDRYWEEQNKIFDKINQAGGMADYLENIENFSEAFTGKDKTICCIDERVTGGIRAAGSLILQDEKEALEFIEKSGAQGITSHAECGAAKLAAKSQGLQLTREQTDQYARDWSQNLARKSGIEYLGRQPVTPSGFHIARTLYYDVTGNFNPARLNGLPAGFVINRKYLGSSEAQREAEIGISIAFGDHGFGQRFNSQTPFILIPILNPDDPVINEKTIMEELEEIESVKKYLGEEKMMIENFVVPYAASVHSHSSNF